MQIFEGYEGMYRFKVLPDFAKFILENHLVDYIKTSLELSRKMDLPILKFLSTWSEHDLIEYSKGTSAEFLNYLIENRAKDQIIDAISKWLRDQLEIVGKYDLGAQDITMIIYIRSRSLKKFIPNFTSDINTALQIADEIDIFNLGEGTSATDTYIKILKDKIEEEVHFNTKLAGTSPGMVYVYDLLDKNVIYFNNKAADVLGYTGEAMKELGSQFLNELAHPDDVPKIEEHMQCFKDLKDGESCFFEHRLKDAKGNYRWLRNYETIFKRNNNGDPTQIIGAAYDITSEKNTSENLKQREEQLLEAQSIANIGSFEYNFKTNTANNSAQYHKIFEYEGNKAFDEFMSNVHTDDKEKVRRAFTASLQTGEYECEYRYVINEKEKYVWSRGFVTFENGEPCKMVGTVQDITDRRKIEEILLQKTIELEKKNADLTEFTYVASHDLKEPLRKIALYSDMILSDEENALNDKVKYQFEKIQDASKRMYNMIEDILAISSLTINKKKTRYSLQEVLNDVQQMLEHSIKEKNATINVQPLPEAYIVPSLFRQLFLNLIGNSLKFSKKDVPAEINISYSFLDSKKLVTDEEAKACHLQIKFSDNGIGFNNASNNRIFLLFQKLHNKKEYSGTGLGLAIAKKIVEEHNGTIIAQSEAGAGATFTVTIPHNK